MINDITFRKIEQQHSITVPEGHSESALGAWYEDVRDKPLGDFTVGELCRACRQELYVHYIVPVMIRQLRKHPLAGDLYDGELLVSLRSVPAEYWAANKGQAKDILTVVRSTSDCADSSLKDDIDKLQRGLSNVCGP